MKQLLLASLLFAGSAATAQVAVNNDGSPPHGSAQLEIKSANRGLLLPRVNTAAITNPAEGLLVYNAGNNQVSYHDGSGWNDLSAGRGLYDKFPNSNAYQGASTTGSPTYTEFNWVVPAGITQLWIEAWAGGDPGRAVQITTTAGDVTAGTGFSGGDAGDYGSFIMEVTPGETLVLRVGKGGVANTSSTFNGGNTSVITTASPARNITVAHQAAGLQYNGVTNNTTVAGLITYVAGEAGHVPDVSFQQSGATQYRRIFSGGNGGDAYPAQKGGKGVTFVFDMATGELLIGGLIAVTGKPGAAPGAGGGASLATAGNGGAGMIIVHW